MADKSHKSKGDSAYRIKRAKKKKPVRLLELGILFLFVLVVAYAVSFALHIKRGYSRENRSPEYFINLQVLNGCGDRGLANELAGSIEAAVVPPLAVRVIDTDNFDNFGVEKTFVISRKEDLTAASILAEQLGLDQPVIYRELDDNYLDLGATLVLGEDCRQLFGAGSLEKKTE